MRKQERRGGRDESGLTILEVVVAVAVLALLSFPIARVVIVTETGANQNRLRVEAINVATNTMESLQNQSYFGVLQTSSTTTDVTVLENTSAPNPLKDTFSVTTTLEPVNAGSDQSVCTDADGSQIGAQIWLATVDVAWRGDDGAPVSQTTQIAPNQAGAVPQDAGEVVVPLVGPDSSAYTASPVYVTIIGTGSGAVPQKQVIAATASTGGSSGAGNTGCVVFQNLDPDGYTYSVYIGTDTISNPKMVPPPPSNETGVVLSTDQPGLVNGGATTAVPTDPPYNPTPFVLTAGQITVAPTVNLAGVGVPSSTQGATMVGTPVQTERCTAATPTDTCTFLPTAGPGSVAPAPGLPVTVTNSQFTSAEGSTFSFDTKGALSVSSISVFPYGTSNPYGIWAGDTDDSNPDYSTSSGGVYPGAPTPPTFGATPGGAASVTVPVFPLALRSSAPDGTQLTITEAQSPQETYDLQPFSGGKSVTGVPLGQFQLGIAGGGMLTPAQFVWVTPTAVYYGASSAQPGYTPPGYPSSASYPAAVPVTGA